MHRFIQPQTPPEEAPWTVDELIRQRASTDPDAPLVAYPDNDGEYIDYTARQLDVYAYRVAQTYAKVITPRSSSAESAKVVGLLARSTIDYLISTLALTKLGMTVLFLSTRISDAAYISLLKTTGCSTLLIDSSMEKKAPFLKSQLPDLSLQMVASRDVYHYLIKDRLQDTSMDSHFDHLVENLNLAWIIHSSGSTGLPKPIYQTHAAALRNYSNNFSMRGFITLPLYHAHGISSVFRAIHSKKQIHIYSASSPLTGPNLLDTMRTHQFEIFYGVPYALKLLSEMEKGLNVLSKLKLVMFGGSSCPDVLGDKLVHNGVKLISHYGT
jgi:acyl-CoA synthetase (AMP-forming)/AMP-acid ligase II